MKLTILRLLLLAAGLGWGATVIGVFIPWEWATAHLETFGGSGPIPDDNMLNYWMRMAAAAFGLIGVFFLLAAWKPYHYKNIIPLLGYGSIVVGLVLIFYGLKFELPLFPFGVDVLIAMGPGIGILTLSSALDNHRA